MNLWHDDIRKPPVGWAWARSNRAAIQLLLTGAVDRCSLDHDLGLQDVEWPDSVEEQHELMLHHGHVPGQVQETGLDLVRWMCDFGYVPERVGIHSWNPPGAQRMAEELRRWGREPHVEPYSTDLVNRLAVWYDATVGS